MASFNKVQLLGRVGRDPETRYTQSGDPISNFSLATSQKVKGEERTEWHQVSVFGKTAEIVEKYVRKGALILVEGRLQSREYTDKTGQVKKVWEIVGSNVVLVDTKKSDERVSETSAAVWKGGSPADRIVGNPPFSKPSTPDGSDPIPF
jgi:single-strand DNA-binding protein